MFNLVYPTYCHLNMHISVMISERSPPAFLCEVVNICHELYIDSTPYVGLAVVQVFRGHVD